MSHIGAVILAAGRSRRFGAANKLLSDFDGEPLWWRALTAVQASTARPVVVVLGHEHARLRASLRAFRRMHAPAFHCRTLRNPHYRDGMAGSLRAGLSALRGRCDGAVIVLADMPQLRSTTIDALIAAYGSDVSAVVPRSGGRRGNPVLLGHVLFDAVAQLRGDEGARRLLANHAGVRLLDVADAGFDDIDTRRDWRRAAGWSSQHARRHRPAPPFNMQTG
ncbi:MAG: nucleotidyltransferase family protein, partial [Solimonas sp.]